MEDVSFQNFLIKYQKLKKRGSIQNPLNMEIVAWLCNSEMVEILSSKYGGGKSILQNGGNMEDEL